MALSFFSGTGLPRPPTAVSQTMPMRLCGPKGTSTKLPGGGLDVLRQEVVVGLVERHGHQNRHARAFARVYQLAFIELCEQAFQTGASGLERRIE